MYTDQGEESNEYCELNGGIPINFEFILSKQVTLREKGYTACELGRNDVENQEKFAACLAAIGFDGYRFGNMDCFAEIVAYFSCLIN